MRREEKFVQSHAPYAVDLDSLATQTIGESIRVTVKGAWFRRRRGVTVACIGYLWSYQRPAPVTALEFLERHTDGRYGGNTCGRWDGDTYWGNGNLSVQADYLTVLRPMLANHPELPEHYDGWWTYR